MKVMMRWIAPRWWRVLLTLLLGIGARPTLVVAQEPDPPMLVVLVRDAQGTGVANLTVLVRDASGQVVFARAATDAAGVASLAALPSSAVRVAVAGQTAAGTPLTMTGHDALGVSLQLGMPPSRLDLRVEPSGLVIPDPTTMLALEVGVPLTMAPIPTAPIAGLAPAATTTAPTARPSPLPAEPLIWAPAEPRTSPWAIGAALALCLVLALMLALLWRWRRGAV
jgi:hypothetical protein